MVNAEVITPTIKQSMKCTGIKIFRHLPGECSVAHGVLVHWAETCAVETDALRGFPHQTSLPGHLEQPDGQPHGLSAMMKGGHIADLFAFWKAPHETADVSETEMHA